MSGFASADLAEIQFPQSGSDVAFRLLQDGVAPRPVFLVSTLSNDGIHNVAPYSLITAAAITPPSFVISILRKADGTEKDTAVNARSSGEMVLSAVTEPIVGAANACAESLAADKSEFEFSGLTPAILCAKAAHVAQSPLRFECRLEREITFGEDGGATSLVIVSVSRAFCAKAFYRGKGQLDITGLRLIGRSGIDQYLLADGQFTVARPNTGEVI